jgi:hypothetical protein
MIRASLERVIRWIGGSGQDLAVRLQERMNSPLENRKVRLRGLWGRVSGDSNGIALRPQAPPSPTLPRKLRGGGRTAEAVSGAIEFSPFSRAAGERGRGRGGLSDASSMHVAEPGSIGNPNLPQQFWGRWARFTSPEGAPRTRAIVSVFAVLIALLSSAALLSSSRAPQQAPAPQAEASPAAPDAFVFATARYESGDWNSAPLVATNILHSIAQYTALPVASAGAVVDLASPELFRFPFVFLTGHLPVRFNQQESANLKAYVERGGFIFIDDHNHDVDGGFHKTATAEIRRIFGAASLKPIPNNHELYRAFFVFPEGPPTTSHELNGWGDNLIHENLFGVEVNGRIGVLYSNKDYASEWNYHARNKRFNSVDNTRFGVNVAVYALTR